MPIHEILVNNLFEFKKKKLELSYYFCENLVFFVRRRFPETKYWNG